MRISGSDCLQEDQKFCAEDGQEQVLRAYLTNIGTYKHLSSTTLMIDRRPFLDSFGVGAAAREPSPRKIVESSHFVSCAASRMVKGRTRTVTEIDEAPSETAMIL